MSSEDASGAERILGLDVALRCTGFGVVERTSAAISVLDCGYIRTDRKAPLSECLGRLYGGLSDLISRYPPQCAVLEGGFFSRNPRTAMLLGMARGAAVSLLADRNVPVYEYSPRRIKQAVCGYGNAGKEQVARLVGEVLNLDPATLQDDTTDALAACLCHAHSTIALQGLHVPSPL